MLSYYDELKNSILEALREEENKEIINQATDKDEAYYKLYDKFFVKDAITGNASGSYYFSTYKARKQCYNFFRDVFEALEEFGYNERLENFKIFTSLVEEGYLNIETMTLNEEVLNDIDEDGRYYIFYEFEEELEEINFEVLDVITRCYKLGEVLADVLDAIL